MSNELYHYGTPKHSGRYPWGSGEDPYHHGSSAPAGWRKKLYTNKDGNGNALAKFRTNRELKDLKKYGKAAYNVAKLNRNLKTVGANNSAIDVKKSKKNEKIYNKAIKAQDKFLKLDSVMNKRYKYLSLDNVVDSEGYEFLRAHMYDPILETDLGYETLELGKVK